MSTISVEQECDNFIDLEFDFDNDTAVLKDEYKENNNSNLSPREQFIYEMKQLNVQPKKKPINK